VLKLYLPEAVDAPEAGTSIREVDVIAEPGSSIAPLHRTASNVSAPNESTRLPSFASGHRGAGR